MVAACEPDSGHVQNTILQPRFCCGTGGDQLRSSYISSSIPASEAAELYDYVPYVHVSTGERAIIPFRVDPATGLRFPIAEAPPDFAPVAIIVSNAHQLFGDVIEHHAQY